MDNKIGLCPCRYMYMDPDEMKGNIYLTHYILFVLFSYVKLDSVTKSERGFALYWFLFSRFALVIVSK